MIKTNCEKQPLDFIRNMQLTELAPTLPVGKSNNILQMKTTKRKFSCEMMDTALMASVMKHPAE